jgi:hypothetical protein
MSPIVKETQNQLQFQDHQSGQSANCGFKSQKKIKTRLSIAFPLSQKFHNALKNILIIFFNYSLASNL